MSNTPLINDCLACDEFDKKTKELVRSFLGLDEVTMIIFLLAGTIHARHAEMAKAGADQAKRIQARQAADFAAKMLGKFMLACEPAYEQALCAKIQKMFGFALKFQHEPCPHQGKENPPGACL